MISQKIQNQFTGWTAVPPPVVSLLKLFTVNLLDPIFSIAHLAEDKREDLFFTSLLIKLLGDK